MAVEQHNYNTGVVEQLASDTYVVITSIWLFSFRHFYCDSFYLVI